MHEKDDRAELTHQIASPKADTEPRPNLSEDEAIAAGLLPEPPDPDECPTCGGSGELSHDCGDDTCCCADASGPICPTCGGM